MNSINFNPTTDEIVEARSVSLPWSTFNICVALAVFCVIIVYGIPTLNNPDFSWAFLGESALKFAVFFGTSLVLSEILDAFGFHFSRRIQPFPTLIGSREIRWDERTIRFTGASFDIVYRWHSMSQIDTTRTLVILRHWSSNGLIIPKRALDKESEEEIRRYFQRAKSKPVRR